MEIEIKFRALCDTEEGVQMVYFEPMTFDNGLWFQAMQVHINEHLSPPMQYTGFKDKNDVEIYRGDILILHPENHFPIVLDGKLTNDLSQIKSIVEFGLNRLNKNSNLTVLGFALKSVYGSGYTVFNSAENLLIVGNIYQNPELLS